MTIEIKKIGKMFEIKGIFNENVVTRYANINNIEERIKMLFRGGIGCLEKI